MQGHLASELTLQSGVVLRLFNYVSIVSKPRHDIEMEEIRLVRSQDNLYGMTSSHDGDVILKRDVRTFNRNTTHFSVNGAVGSHAYGSFDGAIAIIANPKEMPVPSGFGQADVWFHHDKDGYLNVGKAMIIAPYGWEIPPGINVIRYDLSLENSRNQAIAGYLESQRVAPQTFSMWGWAGSDAAESKNWQEVTSKALYGDKSERIQLSPHSGSLDEVMDSSVNSCEGFMRASAGSYLYECENGEQRLSSDVLSDLIARSRDSINAFVVSSSDDVVSTSAIYVGALLEKLSDIEKVNEKNKGFFRSPYVVVDSSTCTNRSGLSFDDVESLIAEGSIARTAIIEDIRFDRAPQAAGDLFMDVKWPSPGLDSALSSPVTADPSVVAMPPPLPAGRAESDINDLPTPVAAEQGNVDRNCRSASALGTRFSALLSPPTALDIRSKKKFVPH